MPKGDLRVHSGPLNHQDVDEELAAQYEIPKAEARAHINARMKAAFGKVHGAFQKIRNKEGEGEAPDPSAVFGVDPGEMYTDRESAKEGIKNMVSFIGAAIQSAVADEEQLDVIKDKFDQAAESLMSEDGQLAEVLKGAEQGLAESAPKLGAKLEELAESLKKAAAKLQEPEAAEE